MFNRSTWNIIFNDMRNSDLNLLYHSSEKINHLFDIFSNQVKLIDSVADDLIKITNEEKRVSERESQIEGLLNIFAIPYEFEMINCYSGGKGRFLVKRNFLYFQYQCGIGRSNRSLCIKFLF